MNVVDAWAATVLQGAHSWVHGVYTTVMRDPPEHRQPVQQRHLDDKGEQVVDDGVQELVCHLAPGQVRHRLELVVQVQLRWSKQQMHEQLSKSTERCKHDDESPEPQQRSRKEGQEAEGQQRSAT